MMLEQNLQKKLIDVGRSFMKFSSMDEYSDFESDQTLARPQPPLVKANMRPCEHAMNLPRNFSDLKLSQDLIEIFTQRKSSRVYTDESMSILALSFLLWATQGVKDVRGKSYATMRTVASGGARHGFETYLLVQNVDGLKPGRYHYLPLGHQLEFLGELEDAAEAITSSLCGQRWAARANVIFYWSFVAYRCEWRYGIYAHRPALMDAGHVGQNLYLACTALGIGTCAIAAFDNDICNRMFDLDGEEEFMIYTAPVGCIQDSDIDKEQAFYHFVKEQGL